MAIPDYQTLMLPLLEYAVDKKQRSLREAIQHLADKFGLSEGEVKELLPSGRQPIIDNRVAWARTYLNKAGLLESPKRGFLKITDRGLEVLKQPPIKIDVNYLSRYSEFVEFRSVKKKDLKQKNVTDKITEQTPEELLELGYEKIHKGLTDDLLDQIKSCTPDFFERLVVGLLLKMGYGGSRQDAGKAIGKSGDEGIDGVIHEDKLGLDVIYIQAKRWDGTVGRPEIQKFVGALQGQRAKKGVFITTSSFSKEAKEYSSKIENKVVLVDGDQLAEFMIQHNLGVSTIDTYEIKKIDMDYFTDD